MYVFNSDSQYLNCLLTTFWRNHLQILLKCRMNINEYNFWKKILQWWNNCVKTFIGSKMFILYTFKLVGSQTDKDLWANSIDITSSMCHLRNSGVASFVEKWLRHVGVHYLSKYCQTNKGGRPGSILVEHFQGGLSWNIKKSKLSWNMKKGLRSHGHHFSDGWLTFVNQPIYNITIKAYIICNRKTDVNLYLVDYDIYKLTCMMYTWCTEHTLV